MENELVKLRKDIFRLQRSVAALQEEKGALQTDVQELEETVSRLVKKTRINRNEKENMTFFRDSDEPFRATREEPECIGTRKLYEVDVDWMVRFSITTGRWIRFYHVWTGEKVDDHAFIPQTVKFTFGRDCLASDTESIEAQLLKRCKKGIHKGKGKVLSVVIPKGESVSLFPFRDQDASQRNSNYYFGFVEAVDFL